MGQGNRSAATVEPLEIRLLGRFDVLRSGESIPENAWDRPKTKTLLKILLTRPGMVFMHDSLIEELFPGDDPERARANLYSRVSQLRRTLEPDLARGSESHYVLRRGQGYCFEAGPSCWVDTVEFRRKLMSATDLVERREWADAVEALEEAVGIFRGEFLPEDRYEVWAEGTAQELRECHLDALLTLAECCAQMGRLRQAISHCQRILAIEPHREDAVCRLMEYQDQAGQRAEALKTYEEVERVLKDYLGVEPSSETQAVYSAIRDPEPLTDEPADLRRIAVLPLADYGPESKDTYFADGMTEELIGCLSRIGDLRVIARTSVMRYKETRKPIAQVGRELGAGAILEGSIRRAGDDVRISVQLIDAVTEDHLWAGDYDRTLSDVLSVQRDVAKKVAKVLAVRLLPRESERKEARPMQDGRAYLFHLEGLRAFEVEQDYDAAGQAFERAIESEPDLAVAHVGLATTLIYRARSERTPETVLPRAREALDRALSLDPASPEAHATLGLVRWVFDRDAVEAEAEFREAIALNPSYGQAHEWLGDLMVQQSRFHEALAEARHALALRPLLPDSFCGVGRKLLSLSRPREAITYFEQAAQLAPRGVPVLLGIAAAKERLYQWEEAEKLRRDLIELHPESPFMRSGLMLLLLTRGKIDEALGMLDAFRTLSTSDVHASFVEGVSQLLSRRYDEAVDSLSRCADASDIGLPIDGRKTIIGFLGIAHAELGRLEDALRCYETARQEGLAFGDVTAIQISDTACALTKARMGNPEDLPRALDRLIRRSSEPDVPVLLAILHFAAKDFDAGFEWLNTAVDRHERAPLSMIRNHPWFDPARSDPRFRQVLERMNLAD
ncbi:MAG: tetratricopeptide repeat protein [Candidatus Bipolaricaulota bacterium]|nr:MAG: tetratricopeptide repeat protein [Candidatus Bipolaricaulota bacterium]